VLYEVPSCSTIDGMAVDGLTRPFVSLVGPASQGVFELGYKKLHKVVPRYALLAVSPVGDMLVGPRMAATTGSELAPSPVLRTLLVWQGVGGPIVIGDARNDLRAERFLAWSGDGHRAAILGTLGDVRAVWLVDIEPGLGRERPRAVSPELPTSLVAVGATFAGDTVLAAAGGKLYASAGRGYQEVELPDGAPAPTGPMLWIEPRRTPDAARRHTRGAMDISVIGAGRVGTALAVLLARAGHRIAAVSGRDETVERAARFLPGTPVLPFPEAAAAAEVVLIGVPDASVEAVASELPAGPGHRSPPPVRCARARRAAGARGRRARRSRRSTCSRPSRRSSRPSSASRGAPPR
jgi:hypothetical protein